ncbi:hypothetical protein QQG55_45680 [Brugia pahangi]
MQLNKSIPSITNISKLMTASSKPSSMIISNFNDKQLDISYDQFLDNNNNKNIICNQDCIPFCQCIQQNTLPITSADQNHQHPIVKAIDQQPVISEGLLHQQLALNNKNDNMLNHTQAFCASFCMQSCHDQCIHQAALLSGNVVYSTSLPMYPYSLSPLVQSQQSTTFIDQQAEQQYLTKMEQISANEENEIQHFSVCLYLCQNNCMQQCMQQNGSLERCSISCHHSCDNNRACDESQQQQLLIIITTTTSTATV